MNKQYDNVAERLRGPLGGHDLPVAPGSDRPDKGPSSASTALPAHLAAGVVDQAADVVFVTDRDGLIQYVNPSFEQITGYGRDEALGARPSLLRSGEHDDDYFARMWTVLLAGQVFRDTIVNRRKSGERLLLEQTISPIRDELGRISHFVSVAKDVTEARRARERDQRMKLARDIQQRFYPSLAPKVGGLDVAGGSWPADHTGGDYYDYLRLPDDGLGLVVADVSGHGFDSALLMAETRAYLRSLSATSNDTGRLLTGVNRVMASDVPDNRFVTMLLVAIDATGRVMRYANAGHVAGLLIGTDGSLRMNLASRGRPLGPFAELEYAASDPFALELGDTLVLVSDGVLEPENRRAQAFGPARLRRTVAAAGPRASALEVVLGIRAAVATHSCGAEPTDDLTVVVCRLPLHSGSLKA